MGKNKNNISADPALFRDLINKSNDATFVADPSTGLFIFVNDKACDTLGYDRPELLGMRVVDIETTFPDKFSWQEHVNELRQKGSLMFEGIHRRKDGTTFPVEANISRVMLNRREYLVTAVRDITERKRIEVAMRLQSEIAANISEGIYLVSADDLRIVYANPKMEEMFGYDPGEMIGKHVSIINARSGEDPEKTASHIEKALKKTGRWRGEVHNIRKDGTTFLGHTCVSTLHHPQYGEVYVSLQSDITARKRAEASLRAREKQLAESQRIAHIGSWEHNIKTGGVFWSDEMFRLFGLEPPTEQADFRMFLEMVHPDDRSVLERAVDETLRNRTPFSIDYRFILKDGTTRIFHAHAELVHDDAEDADVLSGTCQDITDRKYREERLRKINSTILKLDEHDYEGNLNALTRLCGKLLGADCALYNRLDSNMLCVRGIWAGPPDLKKEDKPQGHICFDVINHDSDIPLVVRNLGDTAYAKTDPNVASYGLKTYIGCRVRYGGNSRGSLCVVFTRDYDPTADDLDVISIVAAAVAQEEERYAAVEKLKKSEEFIRSILDTVDESFVVIDSDFRIMAANKAYCDQVDLCPDKIVGRHCYEITYRKKRPCYEDGEECVVRQAFEDGNPHALVDKHVDRGGRSLYLEKRGYPIKEPSGNVTSVIHTINDITERHLLEEERLKTQKLESIGTLAGGIAHDFNNLLQGIFGYISMAKTFIDQKERSLSILEQAENALHQSVSLTTQLLTFSKGGKPAKKRISLLPVIDSAAKFALSGSRSTWRLDIEPGLWQVDADEGQIARVIQNMVLNADQAMPEGGTVVIIARNVEEWDRDNTRVPTGKYVEISIQDSGIGIPGKYLEKIFDPYFTTKEKGSGLGLATSYSIIRSHGGILDAVSEPGMGTTFFIHLPAVEGVEVIRDAVAVPSPAVRGKILVMDDEEVVRTVAGQFLESLNHEVEFAEDGEDLLNKYSTARVNGEPFDIVILDLTVRGGMGGKEALRHLLTIDPDVRAVVSSGYSDDDVVADYRKHGFMACLTKPYKLEDLRDTLNTLLRTI